MISVQLASPILLDILLDTIGHYWIPMDSNGLQWTEVQIFQCPVQTLAD